MNINLAVVFTEYQLLQTEAIVSHYKLKNVVLFVHNKNRRIPDWLIDRSLFEDIVQLPVMESKGVYKISRKYLKYYSTIVSGLLQKRKVGILLGAQDENTVFALIKYHAQAEEYWNIEDGSANYVQKNLLYKGQLFVKKLLFLSYGFRELDIQYGHGLANSAKTFRLYPKLCVGEKDAIFLGNLLREYLLSKVEKIRSEISWISKYREFDTLVVSEMSEERNMMDEHSAKTLFKFHPEDSPSFKKLFFIKENIPLEFLPLLLPNLRTIRYRVASSSILSALILSFDVKIILDFTPPTNDLRSYTNKIIQEFGNRVEIR